MKAVVVGLVPVIVLAGLAAPGSSGAAEAAMTTITLQVSNCEGCTIRPQNDRTDGGVAFSGERATVRGGVATVVVPTSSTLGLTFEIQARGGEWYSERGGQVFVAVQYGGFVPGAPVSSQDAKRAQLGSPCWAGTTDAQATLSIGVEMVQVPTLILDDDDETSPGTATAPLAWFTTTQPSWEPAWQPWRGVLIADDGVDCEAQPRTGPISGQVVGSVRAREWVEDIQVGPSGRAAYVLSGGDIQVMSLPKAAVRSTIRADSYAKGMVIAPNGRTAYTSGLATKAMSVWNLRTQQTARTITAPGWVKNMALAPDGRLLYVTTFSDRLVAMNPRTGAVVWRLAVPGMSLDFLEMSADGRRVYLVSSSGALAAVDTAARSIVATGAVGTSDEYERVSAIAVTPDGARLLIGRPDRSAVMSVDTTTLAEVTRWRIKGTPHDLVVNPQGTRVYVATNGILPIDLVTGSVLREIDVPRPKSPDPLDNVYRQWLNEIAITPDGRRLLAGSSESWTIVVDVSP